MPKKLRWTLYSILSGVLSGVAATIFLVALKWATEYRQENLYIIWALPVVGFFIGWIYFKYGREVAPGNNLIIDEIHDPKKVVPLRMAPFILIGTVLTHLFGGSAGREGTAVQMGASLSDQISKFFRIENEERKILLVAGTGAGFGAAIGAPWAGVIFGMEVLYVGRLRLFAWFECLVASFVGYYTAQLLDAPHTVYPKVVVPAFDFLTLFYIAIAGLVFGLAARGFVMCSHAVENVQARFVRYPPLRPLFGGLLLVFLYRLEGSYQYAGLGLEWIQRSLTEAASFHEPLLKGIFTALTVGSGFKGGEFIPLVFIGSTLGSALGAVLPVNFSLLTGVGFAAVFGAASNTPIACSVMAIEIFGYEIAPYAVVACLMSYYVSGKNGIYKSQRSS